MNKQFLASINEWKGEYITAKQLRSMALKVNKGVQYALDQAEKEFGHRNISGYQLYINALTDVQAYQENMAKRLGVKKSVDIIKSENTKTGEFSVITSFGSMSQEQRQLAMGLLDYLSQNRAMSKSNWDYFYEHEMRKRYPKMFKEGTAKTMAKFEALEYLFQNKEWQAIRKKVDYDIAEVTETITELERATVRKTKSGNTYKADQRVIKGGDVLLPQKPNKIIKELLNKADNANDFVNLMNNRIRATI